MSAIVYRAPLADIDFCLESLWGVERALAGTAAADFVTRDLRGPLLASAAQFAEERLLPLLGHGDREGCRLEAGRVFTPTGFPAAFRRFAEAGWCGADMAPHWGGQGLPQCLMVPVAEMIGSGNLCFGDYTGLMSLAARTLEAHAPLWIKQLYLPRLAAGTWAATMCMTEPHCGTDIGLLRTRAVPRADGTFGLTGNKIFISGGDHDLTENIVHLVLARLPDAPAGPKGISLFLVPKFLPDAKGQLGARNAVQVMGLEEKMGYHASATCALAFEEATGWLIGEPHRGLSAMFTMVNAARLFVGLQGLSLAEVGYQTSSSYARQRRQGRHPGGTQSPEAAADLLIAQPDVRRLLLTQRAFTEGLRALAIFVALQEDMARGAIDPQQRRASADLVALLTPALKAGGSEGGHSACHDALQIFGGHGYIKTTGVEQLARDARLGLIQEGANAIQGFDLLARRLQGDSGAAFRWLLGEVAATAEALRRQPGLADLAPTLREATQRLNVLASHLGGAARLHLAAAGQDFMRVFVGWLFAWVWGRAALAALTTPWEHPKAALARFYYRRLLPLSLAHGALAVGDPQDFYALDEAAL